METCLACRGIVIAGGGGDLCDLRGSVGARHHGSSGVSRVMSEYFTRIE